MEDEHNVSDNRLLGSVTLEKANNMVNSVEPTSNHCSPNESSNSDGVKSRELAANMPNEAFIYREDIVTCRKYEGLHGLVIKVAGDADSESSDGKDDGDIDGDNLYSYLPEGQVRLIWIDGSETVENISDVTVVDRCFFHDDVVFSSSDPAGQLGLVVDVSMTVDLLAADGEVIKHVSSKDLKRIREPLVGDYVVLGPWLGRVEDVVDNVTVLFDDGSVCKVLKADPLQLKPISKPVPDKASSSFYPGQRVRAVSSSVFRNSSWLSGLWKAKNREGTVIEVQAESVVVYWITSVYHGTGTDSIGPSEEQEPKNLTLISSFSCANWKLGDWCHLLSHPLKYSSSVNETLENSRLLIEGSRAHTKHSKESSLGEDEDVHTNSCMEGSHQALDDLNSVLGDHQAEEIPIPEAVVLGETIKASHMIMPGDYDLNIVSTQRRSGCYEKSPISKIKEEFQSQRHYSTTIDEMNKAAKHETNSNNVFPECGSWSSTSSVSSLTTHDSWSAYLKSPRKIEKKPCKTVETALFVANIVTKVDVVWQDGTRENGLPSKYLIPISTLSDHEFFPEQYVMKKSSTEGDDSSEMKHVGVVRSVNSKERTVCVRWFKPLSRPDDSREFDFDEVVSAYELDKHPHYDFCYGDVVIRLSPVSVSADTVDHECSVKQHAGLVEVEPDQIRNYSYCNEAEHVASGEVYEDFTNLSWVGNICSLQDGDIEVKWADGMVSKVGPQEVLVIDREDDGDLSDGESDDGLSWENEMVTPDNAEKEADKHSPIDNIAEWENQTAVLAEDNNAETVGPLSTRLFVLGMISRLCEILLSLARKQLYLSPIEHTNVSETEYEAIEVSARDTICDEFNSKGSKLTEDHNTHWTAEKNSHVAVTEDEENVDASTSMDMDSYSTAADKQDDPGSFKQFDITENPTDHYFNGSPQNSGQRMWVKKIQQEWSILEKNLPSGIYVRVFEERMDLLRAVIEGPCGTPYQDGLFFFDFHFPREYPQVPPSAYYHSGGLRVNPNLYMDGKVCLSLLNTWTGSGNEVWDPSLSSILQVLVSLQGLVLNSKPYFNEPGYEKQIDTIEGEKNVSSYNENTYLLNLKSMLYLLRRPPMCFEGFVKDHFRKRGHYILKACEAYMDGSMIGSLTKDAGRTEKSGEHPCSVGFKLMLAKIMPRLILTLCEIGVDCNQFEHFKRFESLCQS